MIARRAAIALCAAAVAFGSRPGRADARIELLTGVPAESAADMVARALLLLLSRQLPSIDLVIRNLPGDAGLSAMQALAAAPANGSTLGWIAAPVLPARMVDRDAGTLLRRLRLIGAVHKEPIVFVSPVATPLTTVQDIVSRSGEDADAVPLGTPPPGSPPHLAALRLQGLGGTRLNIVTFPSSEAARQAAVGGNVAAAALGMATVIGDLREARLAGLGVAAYDRMGALPDVPLVNESGLPLAASITRGVGAPAGLPDDVAARLAAALQVASTDEEYRQQAEDAGFRVVWIDGPAWTTAMEAERDLLAALWETEPWLQPSGGGQ